MIVRLKNINKIYENNIIYKDFSIDFEENKIYVITGDIGTGKTTLLNIIAGIAPIDGGRVIKDESVKISYLFQENRLLENQSVYHNLKFVLEKSIPNEEIEKQVDYYLKLFGLYEYKYSNVIKLSGGMKKKLAIVRALMITNYNLLILDEPFNNISLNQKKEIMEKIKKYKNINSTIIIVTHDLENVKEFADYVIKLVKTSEGVKSMVNIG